jgi:hypothetical protein
VAKEKKRDRPGRNPKVEIEDDSPSEKIFRSGFDDSREVAAESSDSVVEIFNEFAMKSWEEGYFTAIRIAESEGAVALVETLHEAWKKLWASKGIDVSDEKPWR